MRRDFHARPRAEERVHRGTDRHLGESHTQGRTALLDFVQPAVTDGSHAGRVRLSSIDHDVRAHEEAARVVASDGRTDLGAVGEDHGRALLRGDEGDADFGARAQVSPEESGFDQIGDQPVPGCAGEQCVAGDAEQIGEPPRAITPVLRR